MKATNALATAEAVANQPKNPTLRPKRAGSLIILGVQDGRPCVLMGRRAAGHIFMPNVYVFPGGRVDRADHLRQIAGDLTSETLAKLRAEPPKLSENQVRACAVAAVRETFEETGLIAGVSEDVPQDWDGLLADGFSLDLAPLRYVARAVTPPGSVRRFDARFFAVERSIFGAQRWSDSRELQDLQWVPLNAMDRVPMHHITQRVFLDVAERVKAEGTALLPSGPVPSYSKKHGKFVRNIV